MSVFVTGPTAAGKTHVARHLSKERGLRYINYDQVYAPAPLTDDFSYPLGERMTPGYCDQFLGSVNGDFVIDNIPYDPTWGTFRDWAIGKKDVELICVVPEYKEWLERKPLGGHKLDRSIWEHFWFRVFPALNLPVCYVESPGGEIDHEEAMQRIGMESMIRDRMRTGDYDYRYQDILEVGHVGYSGTMATWANIRPLVDWSKCSVVDCGSFHGFMLFRAGDNKCANARIGLDFMEPALEVSRAVNLLRNDSVEFLSWCAGEPIPETDVTLCLNALHHFPDDSHPLGTHCPVRCSIEDFFDSIVSPITILESYRKYERQIRTRWKDVTVHASARKGRAIYLCR